jgi:ribonuclease VapC
MLQEPGFERLLGRLNRAAAVGIGSPTLVETAIVLSARLERDARPQISRFIAEASVSTIAFGDAHYGAAVQAWLRFGKGRHPAALNFGDCLSYATAQLAGQPLLCTGEDFSKTDLDLA